MNEGGRDNGNLEIKPAMPAPVESGGEVVRSTGDKPASRRLEEPKVNSDRAERIGEKEIKPGIASIKRYFDNPGEINPETREIMEEEKIDLAREDGGVDKVSILELGKFFIDEAVQAFKGKGFSERAKSLLDTTDGFIADKISSDQKFEEDFYKKLGKGDVEKGKVIWATLRDIKRDAYGEIEELKAADKASEAVKEEEKVSSATQQEIQQGIDEISEMTGIDKDDFKTILSAPIDEESAKKLFEDAGILPAPLQSDGGGLDQASSGNESKAVMLSQAAPVSSETGSGAGNATSQAEGGSGGGGGDEGNGGSRSMGAGVPAAPMGSGDYEQYDGDGGRGKNKFREGDRHKRLKDFLKRHFGKEALLIYALMLLALYCGAVYHTARVLEENAERSRAGRSSL